MARAARRPGGLRRLAAEHAGRRAQLRAYEAAVGRFRGEEFGGEDPLDPGLRGVLELAQAAERAYEELWAPVARALRPLVDDGGGWPPPLDDEALAEELRAETEEHLRGEWDA